MVKEEEALNKAANLINKGTVKTEVAKPKPKNQTSNAKSKKEMSEDEKLLDNWIRFVKGNNLAFKDNKGDAYLKVEAWNYLFAQRGLQATILDMSRYEEDDGTLYIAKAALIPLGAKATDTTVPLGVTAFGACRVDSDTFYKDDYSALSMAQTRAIGKLGRTAYAHLAIACGFKATPLEEMVFDGNGNIS